MLSIAVKYGFADARQLVNFAPNRVLITKRVNPNVLYPGDVVEVPDPRVKTELGATDKKHHFQLKRPKRRLRLALQDEEGKALAGADYELVIGNQMIKGNADASGLIEAQILITAVEGSLHLPKYRITWPVHIGHLDPAGDDDRDTSIVTGLQARLNNLGFYAGPVDGELGPQTRAALMHYQRAVLARPSPDGEPDRDTRAALLKDHGC